MGQHDESPSAAQAQSSGSRGTVALVAASVICLFALTLFAGGGWALWKDRVDRDSSGLLSTGTIQLDTETYAIVGELRGDGPGWLYEPTVLGNGRVRLTSEGDQPVFVGIARDDDVARYLDGAGYTTIENFGTSARTTHAGREPSSPPSQASIWAASTEGSGQQTVRWKPRAGDWSIVLMNADASADVVVRGDLSGELPLLPWVAGALLIVGGALGLIGAWLFLRGIRTRSRLSGPTNDDAKGSMPTRLPAGAGN